MVEDLTNTEKDFLEFIYDKTKRNKDYYFYPAFGVKTKKYERIYNAEKKFSSQHDINNGIKFKEIATGLVEKDLVILKHGKVGFNISGDKYTITERGIEFFEQSKKINVKTSNWVNRNSGVFILLTLAMATISLIIGLLK